MEVRDVTNGAILASQAHMATGLWQRFIGLMFKRSLADGHGLLFDRCKSIHTCWMRFPIDVLFIRTESDSRAGVVVKMVSRMAPFRLSCSLSANMVIELSSGIIEESSCSVGHMIKWSDSEESKVELIS